MPRRAFTLIELLVIVAILSIMVSVGLVSITAGQGAARVKGATRDIYAAIRHARSAALVTGQPAVVTYSTATVDGEVTARIEVSTAKLIDTQVDRSKVVTLSGEPLRGAEVVEPVRIGGSKAETSARKSASGDGKSSSSASDAAGGETIEDILFAPIDAEIVKGMRLKVLMGDEELESAPTVRKSGISVFSNVDYLLKRFNESKEAEKKKAQEAQASGTTVGSGEDAATPVGEDQEPVSVVWETNGRVEPHKVWVYPDGKRPEDGLLLNVDRFGAVKVLPGDGREED